MPFTTGLFEAPIGITVPYAPETTQARQNHGFTDLRGNPRPRTPRDPAASG